VHVAASVTVGGDVRVIWACHTRLDLVSASLAHIEAATQDPLVKPEGDGGLVTPNLIWCLQRTPTLKPQPKTLWSSQRVTVRVAVRVTVHVAARRVWACHTRLDLVSASLAFIEAATQDPLVKPEGDGGWRCEGDGACGCEEGVGLSHQT
jgi:hypothetical protein